MRMLLVLCVIGLAEMALANPGVFRERMSREFRNIKSVGGFKHPLNPLHVFRNQLSKSMKSASHRKKMVCELCPPPSDMEPCSCECECNTTTCLANIICNSSQVTAPELQRVLSLPSYPVRNYESLLVDHTFLGGPITQLLLGSTVSFKEINFHLTDVGGVDDTAFNNTGDTLRRLNLNNNMIVYMNLIRKDMPNVQYIDISNNGLMYIQTDSMPSEHLNFLNVSCNAVKNVQFNAFRGLTKLTNLDLSHNLIMTVVSTSFAFINHEDFPLLVNLSHNRITNVESNAFSGAKELTVDLKYNRLETLNEEIFRNFIDSTDGSIHIDVTGNPIVCDCFLLWVVQNSTVTNCFDDFPVCDSTIRNITTENLGDCGQNKTTASLLR